MKSTLASLNPGSNTGFYSQIAQNPNFLVSLDTITVVLSRVHSYERVSDIICLLDDLLGEKIEFERDRPMRIPRLYHGSSKSSLKGTQVLWRMPSEEWGAGELRVHIPGRALRGHSPSAIITLFSDVLAEYEPRCTRIDIAIDDFKRVGTMEDWLRASRERNYTGVRTSREIVSHSLDSDDVGATAYFGSNQSEKMIRAYDKKVESKGRYDCIRIEGQFRKNIAKSIFDLLSQKATESFSGFARTLSGIVFGQFSIIDRQSGDKNIDRKKLLPWFKKIVDAVGSGFKVRIARPEKTLERTAQWVERSVAPSLAMLKKFYGDSDFWQNMNEMIDDSAAKLSTQKRAVIEATRLAFDWQPPISETCVVDEIVSEQLDYWSIAS